MFRDAFVSVDPEVAKEIIDRVNGVLEHVSFDPVAATVMVRDLPFWPGHELLDITDHSGMPPLRRYVVSGPDGLTVLDGMNDPVRRLNENVPVVIDDDTVQDYVRFFFAHVRTRPGRFSVVENVDEISWSEDLPPTARKAIGRMIEPVILMKRDRKTRQYILTARILFRDSLFRTEIRVDEDGKPDVVDEVLLVEHMPVIDDVLRM